MWKIYRTAILKFYTESNVIEHGWLEGLGWGQILAVSNVTKKDTIAKIKKKNLTEWKKIFTYCVSGEALLFKWYPKQI